MMIKGKARFFNELRYMVMARKLILFFCVFGLAISVYGQTKEINPSVQWKIVRIQDLQLGSGELYAFDIPVEKGYDYLCNLTHNKDSLYANISIYDLQNQPIKVFDSGVTQNEVNMNFKVSSSATHKLVIGVIDPIGRKGDFQSVKFALIRRPQI